MIRIEEFNPENFASALSNRYTSAEVISTKMHFKYLLRYLGHEKGLGARTIVVEESYISKDFLHDYVAYYSLCFTDYEKVCKRVHLFSHTFSEDEFLEILVSKDHESIESFWANYLGNIVVKPIPITVIGTTILKTYPHEGEFVGRNYWGLKDYSVHIFGTKKMLRSLVFQEQDKVLAACATTAIWSTLNKTFHDFQASIKSPSQITRDADITSNDGSRLFPNKGLDILQVCHAIERSGLVCEVKNCEGNNKNGIPNGYLKELVRAYSPIGIPIILIIKVSSQLHLHAITLVGHRHQGPFKPKDAIGFVSMSDAIDRIYAHDDQWGPFARITFGKNEDIITPWNEEKSEKKLVPVTVNVTDVIISLYPKVRISYLEVKSVAIGIHGLIREFSKAIFPVGFTWDIRLLYSENYKEEIKTLVLEQQLVLDLIVKPMPKFIWVASCYAVKTRLADFTFDATGVTTAMNGLHVITFINGMKKHLNAFIRNNKELFFDYYDSQNANTYYDWLLTKTEDSLNDS